MQRQVFMKHLKMLRAMPLGTHREYLWGTHWGVLWGMLKTQRIEVEDLSSDNSSLKISMQK